MRCASPNPRFQDTLSASRRAPVAIMVALLLCSCSRPNSRIADEVRAIRLGTFATLPFKQYDNLAQYREAIDWLARRMGRSDQVCAGQALSALVAELRSSDKPLFALYPDVEGDRYRITLEVLTEWLKIARAKERHGSGSRTDVFRALRPGEKRDSPNDPWWIVAAEQGVVPEQYLSKTIVIGVDCNYPEVEWAPSGREILCVPGDGSLGVVDPVSGAFGPLPGFAELDDVWKAKWTRGGRTVVISTRDGLLLDATPRMDGPGDVAEIASTVRRFDDVEVFNGGSRMVAIDQISERLHWFNLGDTITSSVMKRSGGYLDCSPLEDGSDTLMCTRQGAFWLSGPSDTSRGIDSLRSPATWSGPGVVAWALSDARSGLIGHGKFTSDPVRFGAPPGGPTGFAFSPDGNFLAATCQGSSWIGLVEVASGQVVWVYSWVEGWRAVSLSWSPDGQFLASGHTDGAIRIWALPEHLR